MEIYLSHTDNQELFNNIKEKLEKSGNEVVNDYINCTDPENRRIDIFNQISQILPRTDFIYISDKLSELGEMELSIAKYLKIDDINIKTDISC